MYRPASARIWSTPTRTAVGSAAGPAALGLIAAPAGRSPPAALVAAPGTVVAADAAGFGLGALGAQPTPTGRGTIRSARLRDRRGATMPPFASPPSPSA